MKNSTTASTSASLSTDHGSSRLSWSAAWRGGRDRGMRAQDPVSVDASRGSAGGGVEGGGSADRGRPVVEQPVGRRLLAVRAPAVVAAHPAPRRRLRRAGARGGYGGGGGGRRG